MLAMAKRDGGNFACRLALVPTLLLLDVSIHGPCRYRRQRNYFALQKRGLGFLAAVELRTIKRVSSRALVPFLCFVRDIFSRMSKAIRPSDFRSKRMVV